MAQCKLTPHEFIQNAFSPMVAVMCSTLVDQACQKNNLSFVEMIQPFCKLNIEAYIRDASGTSVPLRNLRIDMVDINSRPPQPTLARKFLNESVSLSSCDRNTSVPFGKQAIDIPASVPWFEAWRETFLQVQFPSDHEFTKHYVACVFVVSSSESSVADILQQMSQQLQQMQNMTPAKLPKWFCPNVLRYYVLLHDTVEATSEVAETAFNAMKTAYGPANSFLLQVNSRPLGHAGEQDHLPDPWSQFLIRHHDNQEVSQNSSPRSPGDVDGVTAMPSRLTTDGSCDGEPTESPRPATLEVGQEAVAVTLHPLSPDTDHLTDGPYVSFNPGGVKNHINANVWAGQSGASVPHVEHGACLTPTDLEAVRHMMQEFVTKALLPYVEKQIQQYTEIISNRKGVSRSLFSATKRWFGSNKPGVPGSNAPVNAVIYAGDAPELQLRRLGDLCFMFGLYALAFQAYHSAKRDFSADQAWLYYAGALEMAALAAFMQGETARKAQDYLDESILTYLNSCKMPQFATRATLLSSECLKARGLHGEAAKQLIRMTSVESDLRSALLLEQASYCYLRSARPRMARKYAFHIVLAGHSFSKAGQRKHSLRCYRQAYQVYEGKSWSLAENHIHFTVGRLAANLGHVNEAAAAFSHLLSHSSRHSTTQQAAMFLKEFLTTQQQLQQDESTAPSDNLLPILPLPLVDSNKLSVLLGPRLIVPSDPDVVPATGVGFREELNDNVAWPRLEEMLLAEAQGSLPMIFKPTVTLFTNNTNNSTRPVGVVGEAVNVRLLLENPLHIPLPLQQVHLLWRFTDSLDVQVENETNAEASERVVRTQVCDSLSLEPASTQEVVLCVTPQCVGDLHILGVAYNLTGSPVEPGVVAQTTPSLSVAGKQVFELKPAGPKTPSDKSTADRRLEINVQEASPCLQVTFRGLNRTMLSGELQHVSIHLLNCGSRNLRNLHVAWSRPELVSLGNDSAGTRRAAPARNRGHQAARVALDGEGLRPGEEHRMGMWVRAPDLAGDTSMEMMFYYESDNPQSVPRYRLVRHSYTLSVLASVHSTVVANRSNAIGQRRGDEVLNLLIWVKNNNAAADALATEISVLQLSLASTVWRLEQQVVVPQVVNLQSQEMVHLLVKAHRSTAAKSVFSDIRLGDGDEQLAPVDSSPYLDFFNRRTEPGDSSDHPTHHALKEAGSATKVQATLVIRWKAIVRCVGQPSRTVVGQHHLSLGHVGSPTFCPAVVAPSAVGQQEPIGSLKIFGPDAEPIVHTDKYTAFEVLQKLVTYSVQHAPSIGHDFTKSRICIVPARILLQNCSDSDLVVQVNTIGNTSSASSNKNQLYSPHSSGAFRWVAHAGAWLQVAPHGHGSVALSAALAAPGTYDLGARLEVTCRVVGAPEADTVAQTWRIESSLVVNNLATS